MTGASVSRVLIVGAGVDAWLSALALIRALGRIGVEVEVLETPGDPTPLALDASPGLRALHRLVGMTPGEVVAECGALPVVGQRFSDWNRGRGPFVRAYAAVGDDGSHLDFLQHWLRARALGLRAEFSDFSVAGVAVAKGRAPPPNAEWPGADHGYHLDGAAYVALLRRKALEQGVTTSSVADPIEVVRDGDQIRALTTAQGRFSADLYVDATGDAALLSANRWEDWSAWSPVRKLVWFEASRSTPEPVTETLAFDLGWAAVLDISNRRIIMAGVQQDAPPETVLGQLQTRLATPLSLLGSQGLGAPGLRDGWVGNQVALGRAGLRADLLEGGWLLGLQIGLAHLISTYPLEPDMSAEARLFNAAVRRHAEAVRDFQAVHYRLSCRDEAMWRCAAESPPPPSLQQRLDLFGARGVLPPFEDEVFQADDWAMILLGHGLMPSEVNPAALSLDDATERRRLHAVMSRNLAQAASLPSVKDWRAGILAR